MTRIPIAPTERQRRYVEDMQRRLHLPDRMLDDHCIREHGVPFSQLERAQVSDLIETLKAWVEVPAELRRRQGQADLPGMGVGDV